MTLVLFAGGPMHGRTMNIPEASLTPTFLAMPERDITVGNFLNEAVSLATVQPVAYALGEVGRPHPELAYALGDYAAQGLTWYFYLAKNASLYGQGRKDAKREQVARADWLLETRYPEIIPVCVVPGCTMHAPRVFTAMIAGRLAARRWQPGDRIRMCPKHGNDLVQAQTAVGVERLPEWLRPDANLFGIDAYDAATDLVNGSTIAYAQARALLVEEVVADNASQS